MKKTLNQENKKKQTNKTVNTKTRKNSQNKNQEKLNNITVNYKYQENTYSQTLRICVYIFPVFFFNYTKYEKSSQTSR